MRISVIDYDAGNTMSVMNALSYLGREVCLTNDKNELLRSDKIIFPGVGAYADAMNKLKSYDLIDTIKELTAKDIPFLGICLGMQLLFDSSEENIGFEHDKCIQGLSILPGTISHFPQFEDLKIPHMGWNSLIKTRESELFKELPDNPYVYFVHSYYLCANEAADVIADCDYGIRFNAAVQRGNIFGCQFHPEKSGETGLKILDNFCRI